MTFVEFPQLPQFQTAVVAQGSGKLGIQHNVPIPTLTSDMALVKTAAVAINPAAHFDLALKFGADKSL